MKIGIIGAGMVGGAYQIAFEKLGHQVFIHDVKLKTKIEDVIDNTEVIFICVPTPQNEDGSCRISIVESVIDSLKDKKAGQLICIKSTIPPGTTDRLRNKTNLKICFSPEFLRERMALSDIVENQRLLVVGTKEESEFETIVACNGNYPKNSIRMLPAEAEMIKYVSNCFNSTRISFSNEIYDICKKINADYTTIKNAYLKISDLPDIYLDVNENWRKFGGACLPKDLNALIFFAKQVGVDPIVLEAVWKKNTKI